MINIMVPQGYFIYGHNVDEESVLSFISKLSCKFGTLNYNGYI